MSSFGVSQGALQLQVRCAAKADEDLGVLGEKPLEGWHGKPRPLRGARPKELALLLRSRG